MPISYKNDIKNLFRPQDVEAMKKHGPFDLWNYDDVKAHAEDILDRLRDKDDPMPCDGPWPAAQIELFARWIADGMKE